LTDLFKRLRFTSLNYQPLVSVFITP
jgi:hypothetical protein